MTYFAETPKAAFIETLGQNDDRGEALDKILSRALDTVNWAKAHQTTVVANVRADAAMPGTGLQLRHNNLGEWDGTFYDSTSPLLEWALEAADHVSILAYDAGGQLNLYRGIVHSYAENAVEFFDGVLIDRNDILGMGI
jgi:hypothetical protein